jgi:hypothetical protein
VDTSTAEGHEEENTMKKIERFSIDGTFDRVYANNRRNEFYFYVSQWGGETVYTKTFTKFFVAFRTKCKKEETAKARFYKWLERQPFADIIEGHGYILNVYNLCGDIWYVEIYDDLEQFETLYKKRLAEVDPIIPLF